MTKAIAMVHDTPDSPGGNRMPAPLPAACDDLSEYRRLCRQIILYFRGAQDPMTADQMAKDCIILPSSGADLNVVGALTDVALTRGTNYGSYSLFQCWKALAEYRREHFPEAVKWADSAAKDPFPYSKAEAYAILSLARFKAHSALADCDNVIEGQLPKLSGGNLGPDWRDWIIAHALECEVEALLNHATP